MGVDSSNSSEEEKNEKYNTASSDYGYDLYPERKNAQYKPTLKEIIFGEGGNRIDNIKCERNVYSCVKNSPIIKLMMAALKSSGCAIDIRRHIACEYCDTSVTGGYDPKLNQIVVCQNMARHEGTVQGVLAHEMIHMFDYCNNELDFTNLDHLACTEVRAANLTHCSFMSAWTQGDASPFNIRQTHPECVKSKAVASVMAARGVSVGVAVAAVERVFQRCYADLEPIGRRIRRNSHDMQKAYMEAPLYGYE